MKFCIRLSYTTVTMIVAILMGFGGILAMSIYKDGREDELDAVKYASHAMTGYWHEFEHESISLLTSPQDADIRDIQHQSLLNFKYELDNFCHLPPVQKLMDQERISPKR